MGGGRGTGVRGAINRATGVGRPRNRTANARLAAQMAQRAAATPTIRGTARRPVELRARGGRLVGRF